MRRILTLFLFALGSLVSLGESCINAPYHLPQVGDSELCILSPTILEITQITTKNSPAAQPKEWNLVSNGKLRLPEAREFSVTANGRAIEVKSTGFKRRVLYAPLKQRDLRIGNHLYLELANPVRDGETVEVKIPAAKFGSKSARFTATADPMRWSPAIHVNQVGYLLNQPKTAMIGFYLGNLGEFDLSKNAAGTNKTISFQLIEMVSKKTVFSGELKSRPDRGFPFSSYQKVLEADFTDFNRPGEYQLAVPGLGTSFPFRIGDEPAANWARTYALGIYHQRCGTDNALPFTRFTHGPCHVAPAEVPTLSRKFENVNYVLEQETEDAKENRRHSAKPLKNVLASLYPFVNRGPVDVRGGHHDAGDYSKYTANSASFIHALLFAADNFPGVVDLDNLGLPESGDGRSDILQEVKWEADFLAKMQDADGGFYFLVYPRDRRYENDVTPDKGDPQVVFPKTTAASAAATAALAQCASSPKFKQQFPEAAALYLEKAKRGWAFLEKAVAQHGKDGAYQKITHYGNDFMHDDELAWAACELYLATGDPKIEAVLLDWLNPNDPATRKWSWWRLYEAYGHAIRSYAFAERSGRLKASQLNKKLFQQCEDEIIIAAEEQLDRAEKSAYGTSFPTETKSTRTAGWYFSSDAAFDLAVASQLNFPSRNDPRPKFRRALLSNINYEFGCNPVNVTFLTGTGSRPPREIVHQYAQNDRRVLPPAGIPLGNIQDGFGWLDFYEKELGELSFPADDDHVAPYPIYDRWGDSFNLKTEFVISNQARALAYLSWLMAETSLKTQAWKAASAKITPVPSTLNPRETARFQLHAPDLDLLSSRIIWESGGEPKRGAAFEFTPTRSGGFWIEAEALLPDGRRVVAVTNVVAR